MKVSVLTCVYGLIILFVGIIRCLDFLKILKDSEGQDIADWFEKSLKE